MRATHAQTEATLETGNSEDQLLDVAQLAARLRVKPSWVYRHAHTLGALRLGKYVRFLWPRVLEKLEAGTVSLTRQAASVLSATKRKTSHERMPLQ